MNKKNNKPTPICKSTTYESPRLHVQQLALEHSISAGSVQNTVTESWETETQTKEMEW